MNVTAEPCLAGARGAPNQFCSRAYRQGTPLAPVSHRPLPQRGTCVRTETHGRESNEEVTVDRIHRTESREGFRGGAHRVTGGAASN